MLGDEWDDAAPPLVALMGGSTRVKLLSVFAMQRHREFNVTELAREAGVSLKSVYEHLEDFVEYGIVVERDASRGARYAVDPDSDIAATLYELSGDVLRRDLERFREIGVDGETVPVEEGR